MTNIWDKIDEFCKKQTFFSKFVCFFVLPILAIVFSFLMEKILEKEKIAEQVSSFLDKSQLEINLVSDNKNMLEESLEILILYRDDCEVATKEKAKNIFILSCSKAVDGESIHFKVLSGNMFCGKFDRQMGNNTEDVVVNECFSRP